MGRPPTDEHWVKRVAEELGKHHTVAEIERTLEHEASEAGRDDAPKYRTIRRLRDRILDRTESFSAQEQLFEWPWSMQLAAIAWESSRTILDYVQWRIVDRHEEQPLPTIRVAKWLARVCMAAPSLHKDKDWPTAEWLAHRLAAAEITAELKDGREIVLPGLTRKLATQGPWENMIAITQPHIERGELTHGQTTEG
jgi:hypothetical protein